MGRGSTTKVVLRRGKLARLKPALQKWIQILKRYQATSGTDALWWYNERASLSSLAGAFWLSRGVAIEEASNPKRPARRRSKRRRWGRADLSVEYDGVWYAFEAKQVWVSVTGPAAVNQIMAAMSRAKKDVRRVHRYGGQRVAAVFISPWVPKSKKDEISSLIRNFIQRVEAKIKFDALVVVFPRSSRELYWKPELCYYPGTVLLLRVPRQ